MLPPMPRVAGRGLRFRVENGETLLGLAMVSDWPGQWCVTRFGREPRRVLAEKHKRRHQDAWADFGSRSRGVVQEEETWSEARRWSVLGR